MTLRKLKLYIAGSLDGYIAKPDDDLGFLDRVQKSGEDYGYNEFMATVDTVIMGRRTYEWVMSRVDEFPHSDKETYIVTHDVRPGIGNIHFYSGNLKDLILELKIRKGKNIFCDGGATIINELLKHKLIDEIILSVIPVLLGNGIRLFLDGRSEQYLELISSRQFDTGLIQLHYRILAE